MHRHARKCGRGDARAAVSSIWRVEQKISHSLEIGRSAPGRTAFFLAQVANQRLNCGAKKFNLNVGAFEFQDPHRRVCQDHETSQSVALRILANSGRGQRLRIGDNSRGQFDGLPVIRRRIGLGQPSKRAPAADARHPFSAWCACLDQKPSARLPRLRCALKECRVPASTALGR